MKDYFWLIIDPSKAFDKLKERQFTNRTLFFIYTISLYLIFLPKLLEIMNCSGQIMVLLLNIVMLPFAFFFISFFAFIYLKIIQGFNGKISLSEMKMIIIFSLLPFVLKTIILLPFVLLKADTSIINHSNYLTNNIFWLFSFRIIIVGIAKYNKFNWMITLIVWAISTTIIAGIGYLLVFFKSSFPNSLINNY